MTTGQPPVPPAPPAPPPNGYAVTCYTCYRNIWEGAGPPADGRAELTKYAESIPGTACPSGVATCPNKTAAIAAAAQLRPATVGDLSSVRSRLDDIGTRLGKIEAKLPPAAAGSS